MAIALPETLTAANAHQVLKMLTGHLSDAPLIIDLSAVNHCDSAGLAVLIAIKSKGDAKNNAISYANPTQQLTALAQFLKVSDYLFSN